MHQLPVCNMYRNYLGNVMAQRLNISTGIINEFPKGLNPGCQQINQGVGNLNQERNYCELGSPCFRVTSQGGVSQIQNDVCGQKNCG